MTTSTPDARPLPAPLPYRSQAYRDEIPRPPQVDPADLPSEDPDAPLLAEDEFSFWVCTGIVAAFIILMVIVAATGGL